MLQTHRYRAHPQAERPEPPIELARRLVLECAEGPVTFRAMLQTPRREVVAQLAALIQPPNADVGTCSLLAEPRDVPLDEPVEGETLAFIEQHGEVVGLLQQWITVFVAAGEAGGRTTLHLRLARDDVHARGTILARLRACQGAGVLPQDADIDGTVERVLSADVGPDRPLRVPLGEGSLLAQSFFEGSRELLLNLELPTPAHAGQLLRTDLWKTDVPIELRRYSTALAALRAPHVQRFEIHAREDGPLTDALIAARSVGEALTVEWEVAAESELCGVIVTYEAGSKLPHLADMHALHVEIEVRGSVDWEYGPDPMEMAAPLAERARIQVEHLHGG